MSASVAAMLALGAWLGALGGRTIGFSMTGSAGDEFGMHLLAAAGVVVVVLGPVSAWLSVRGRDAPRRRAGLLAVATIAVTLTTGGGAAVRARHVVSGPLAGHVLTSPDTAVGVRLRMVIVGDPQAQDLGGWWMIGRLENVDSPLAWASRTRERVMVRSADPLPIGTKAEVTGLASAVQGDAVPWLRSLGISVEVAVTSSVARAPPPLWLHLTTRLRDRMAIAAGRHLPPGQASLLAGLVTGDVRGQPPNLADDVTAAGLSHLVAVSGSNVALVIAGTMGLALGLGLGRRFAWRVSIATVWWFVVLVRAEPSVVRAALMATLVLVTSLRGRPREALHLLAMAVVLALLLDPLLAARVGFVLSVAATCGVLIITPRLIPLLRGPGWFRMGLAATIGAQVPVAPILLLIGGTVSAATIPANVIAVPAAALASVVGVGVALVATVSTPVAGVLALLARPALDVVVWSATTFAGPAGQTINRWVPIVLLGLAVAFLAHRLSGQRGGPVVAQGRIRRGAVLWGGAVMFIATVAMVLPPVWVGAGGPARMIVLDVGQGDAILVADGAGRWMLVDGGPDAQALRQGLRRHGVRRLDVVVLTHPHADHDAGLDGLFGWIDVATLVVGPRVRGAPTSPIVEQAERAGVPVQQVHEGMAWQRGPLAVQVLSPPMTGIGRDPNESSVVLRVQPDGGSAALLTGDAEVVAQHLLLADLDRIDVDVLKIPHHGGATNAEGFLAATSPSVAVISVGEDNTFGHPHPDVLADLADVDVRRTDVDGDVVVPLAGG